MRGRCPSRGRAAAAPPAGRLGALLAAALLGASAAAAPPAPEPGSPAAETIGLDEVHAGQRGYGLSAFSGNRLDRFEVEVLGVIRNLNPGASYILARLTGHNLEQSGVPQGMSGSPIYLDGRLAGAVSFGWSYSQEAIAGIAPIGDMRAMPAMLPAPRRATLPEPRLRRLLAAGLAGEDLAALLPPPASLLPAGATSTVGWSGIGLGDRSRGLLRPTLGEVAPAGSAALAATEVEAGSPIAAILVGGDLQIAASGTVTERRGDEILAFGHPFLGSGPIRVPMALAEVVTVVSSRSNSFRVSNLGPVVGAFDHDGHHGVRGHLGAVADTIPLEVRVEAGERSRRFELWLARVPDLLPALLASSMTGAMEVASFYGGLQGIDLRASFQVAGHGPLELRQSYDGPTATQEAASLLAAITAYLQLNPLERVEIERISVEVAQASEPRLGTLLDAHLDDAILAPGTSTGLHLRWLTPNGRLVHRSVEVDIPASLPLGRYSLLVGGGASIDSTRLTALEPSDPVNFAQVVRLIRSLHSRRQLVILGLVEAPGLALEGEVLPGLPGSLRSLWERSSQTTVTLRSQVVYRQVVELEEPLEGALRLEAEIRPAGGLPALPAAGEAGERTSRAGEPAPWIGGGATGRAGNRG